MPLPTITGIARAVADPELRFTQSGKAVATVRLAFNSRRKDDRTGEWVDGDTFWVRGTAWEFLAENICETVQKGMEILVSGELRTESWEKDGQKHQAPALSIRSIGPSLAYAVAQVSKSAREQAPANGQRAQQRPQQARQAPQDDPWATGTPAPANSGRGSYDEPPF
ncbi:single-strand binding protein [Actinacidiphila alni]|uniref:Single-stranded DNA-binding protein n=1 Tax=Actinacidiphila alni TaxID=380248 RepID=A0A1I2G317_9ACTN|nr:single-stranded DNA-binding protein [Actinacidiphila alni]SFF11952.1 single-strand binding protein [Actinacidiphila alni]